MSSRLLMSSCTLLALAGCVVRTNTAAGPAYAEPQPQPQVVYAEPAPQPQPQVVYAQPQPQPQVVVTAPQPQPTVVMTAQPTATASITTGVSDQSNFGTVALSSGFTPDPHVVNGTSGGQLSASSTMGGHCRGWIAQRPDHIVYLNTYFNHMRFEAMSGQDTTLVVRGPSGVLCDDDGGGNRNPRIQSSLPPGRYEVWVGSYNQGQYAPYQLHLSEFRR